MATDAGMQVLPLTDHYFNPMSLSSRFAVPGAHNAPRTNGNWTKEENKLFENALALFEGDGLERWQRVAEAVPSKTAWEVMAHYQDLEADVTQIEAGYIPFQFAGTFPISGFTLNWGSSLYKYQDHDHQPPYYSGAKRLPGASAAKSMSDQERKKGVPWTKDEHRLFLLGLNKYGKGDWRNISRNCVRTRTPTQVASHAQKYYKRRDSGNKEKRRPSIHDITTTNLPDAMSPPSSQSSIFTPTNSIDCRPRIY